MTSKYQVGDFLIKNYRDEVFIFNVEAVKFTKSDISYLIKGDWRNEKDLDNNIKLLDFNKTINEQLIGSKNG